MTVKCWSCGKKVKITKHGRIPWHMTWTSLNYAMLDFSVNRGASLPSGHHTCTATGARW